MQCIKRSTVTCALCSPTSGPRAAGARVSPPRPATAMVTAVLRCSWPQSPAARPHQRTSSALRRYKHTYTRDYYDTHIRRLLRIKHFVSSASSAGSREGQQDGVRDVRAAAAQGDQDEVHAALHRGHPRRRGRGRGRPEAGPGALPAAGQPRRRDRGVPGLGAGPAAAARPEEDADNLHWAPDLRHGEDVRV